MQTLLQRPIIGSALRYSLHILALLMSYLIQVSIIPYLKIGGVEPNMLLVTISVFAVAYGRWEAFRAGAVLGILMEVMTRSVTLLNMAFYTAAAIVAGLLFGDKNQQQLEYRRSQGRSGYNTSPLLRTPICCLLLSVLYHSVNLIKIYLSGYDLLTLHFTRAILGVVLTEVLCLLLMIPIRRFLGLHYTPVRREKPLKYEGR